ncbi:MAG TPA: cytochrome C biogenesis protein ResB [Ruminococcaceae bacterium]|nr:cytochrome C biogenesis protein ResB [Oscillospiraceae bacterium]
MRYVLTFLEGFISFVSPCMLPMLPVYLSYFAGDKSEIKAKNTLLKAVAFVIGFTVVFCLLGLFAGSIGAMLKEYKTVLNIVCGIMVAVFGLSYLEIIPLPFLKGVSKAGNITGVLSAFIFGVIYSVSLTPCVGAFLGSALMLAATSESAVRGLLLLLVYSLGLGIPFVMSALLIDGFKGAFSFIKSHYRVINIICGLLLTVMGVLMALGFLSGF